MRFMSLCNPTCGCLKAIATGMTAMLRTDVRGQPAVDCATVVSMLDTKWHGAPRDRVQSAQEEAVEASPAALRPLAEAALLVQVHTETPQEGEHSSNGWLKGGLCCSHAIHQTATFEMRHSMAKAAPETVGTKGEEMVGAATCKEPKFGTISSMPAPVRRRGGYVAQTLETPYQGCCLPWDEGCTVRDSIVASRSRKKAAYAVPARRVVGFITAAHTGMPRPTEFQQDDPVPAIIRSAYAGLL